MEKIEGVLDALSRVERMPAVARDHSADYDAKDYTARRPDSKPVALARAFLALPRRVRARCPWPLLALQLFLVTYSYATIAALMAPVYTDLRLCVDPAATFSKQWNGTRWVHASGYTSSDWDTSPFAGPTSHFETDFCVMTACGTHFAPGAPTLCYRNAYGVHVSSLAGVVPELHLPSSTFNESTFRWCVEENFSQIVCHLTTFDLSTSRTGWDGTPVAWKDVRHYTGDGPQSFAGETFLGLRGAVDRLQILPADAYMLSIALWICFSFFLAIEGLRCLALLHWLHSGDGADDLDWDMFDMPFTLLLLLFLSRRSRTLVKNAFINGLFWAGVTAVARTLLPLTFYTFIARNYGTNYVSLRSYFALAYPVLQIAAITMTSLASLIIAYARLWRHCCARREQVAEEEMYNIHRRLVRRRRSFPHAQRPKLVEKFQS